MAQIYLSPDNHYEALTAFLKERGCKKILLVHDSAAPHLKVYHYLMSLPEKEGIEVVAFSDYKPNPDYEALVAGTEVFRKEGCDGIVALGGGSGMDVAKSVKLFANMTPGELYLKQKIVANEIPFVAIPTTAGTGAESTMYAVIYYLGEKQSIGDISVLPQAILLDPSVLETLPMYQRKCTMLDALGHAMESFWAVKSTEESREHARNAIRGVFAHMEGYLANVPEDNAGMLLAANEAGRAIFVTQTTVGHAMCYKLTHLYGLSHGHSVAFCNRVLMKWMPSHLNRCIDPRGQEYLENTLHELAGLFGCKTIEEAAQKFDALVERMELPVPRLRTGDMDELVHSVNPDRLKNFPIAVTLEDVEAFYREILLPEE
ncbi:MAG: phosphonoacetaldehyde reductase [Lachnospiraceae bacterium]|nr:phosphonoacetaldehyde reductase [Lachnospiraceae bacterium]